MGSDMSFFVEVRFPLDRDEKAFSPWVKVNPRFFGENGRYGSVGFERNYNLLYRLTGARGYNGREELEPITEGPRSRPTDLSKGGQEFWPEGDTDIFSYSYVTMPEVMKAEWNGWDAELVSYIHTISRRIRRAMRHRYMVRDEEESELTYIRMNHYHLRVLLCWD